MMVKVGSCFALAVATLAAVCTTVLSYTPTSSGRIPFHSSPVPQAFEQSKSSSRTSSGTALHYIYTSYEEDRVNHQQYQPYTPNMGGFGGQSVSSGVHPGGQQVSNQYHDVLDMNLSEESIKDHYRQWCAKFNRRQDNFRFIVFQRNYLSQFKWNLAAGKQAFTLNQFADCTEEEYNQLIKKAAETTDVVVRPLEVMVCEEQVEAEVQQDKGIPVANTVVSRDEVIDVEILDKRGRNFY